MQNKIMAANKSSENMANLKHLGRRDIN